MSRSAIENKDAYRELLLNTWRGILEDRGFGTRPMLRGVNFDPLGGYLYPTWYSPQYSGEVRSDHLLGTQDGQKSYHPLLGEWAIFEEWTVSKPYYKVPIRYIKMRIQFPYFLRWGRKSNNR